MTQEELLEIVHTLRSNENCSDADLCEVIKAANQTINLQNLATLIKTSPEQKSKNEALKFTKKESFSKGHTFLCLMKTLLFRYVYYRLSMNL